MAVADPSYSPLPTPEQVVQAFYGLSDEHGGSMNHVHILGLGGEILPQPSFEFHRSV